MMAWIEALAVIGVVALIVYLMTYAIIHRTSQPQPMAADTAVRWVATHYAVNNATRIVVRKVGRDTGDVLDEHIIVEISDGAADFDAKFLEGMAQARARAALFELESD
jgi:hypothetical protein